MTTIRIQPFEATHWPEVRKIYQDGINTGLATFEDVAPEWSSWNDKFIPSCRIVAVVNKLVKGWRWALQPVSDREAYAGVAEVSVYVDLPSHRNGIGRALLSRLIGDSEDHGFWMLTASIFEENVPSISLHQSLGFKIIGLRERIGKKNGKWISTILMDRRSDKKGLD